MRLKLPDLQLGFDDRGVGQALVLLHAFPLDRRMWARELVELSRVMRVLTLDFRGLGESTGHGTIDDAADDVLRLLDAQKVDRAIVGGLSMGGYVALAFARRHPARLAGLLLADTRAPADDAAARAGRDEGITRLARAGVDTFVHTAVPRLLTGRNKAALDYALATASIQSVTGIAGALAALRDRPDATPGLAAIRVPTTVLVGAEDGVTPPAMARQLAEGISGAVLVEIPGAGHLANLEAPGPFTTAVEALVTRVLATH